MPRSTTGEAIRSVVAGIGGGPCAVQRNRCSLPTPVVGCTKPAGNPAVDTRSGAHRTSTRNAGLRVRGPAGTQTGPSSDADRRGTRIRRPATASPTVLAAMAVPWSRARSQTRRDGAQPMEPSAGKSLQECLALGTQTRILSTSNARWLPSGHPPTPRKGAPFLPPRLGSPIAIPDTQRLPRRSQSC